MNSDEFLQVVERKVGKNVDRAGELVVLKKPGHRGDGECRLM